MHTKLPLAVLGMSSVARGFSAPDPLIPKNQCPDPNQEFLDSPASQSRPKSSLETIPGKERVLNGCTKTRAYSMQWLFRQSTASFFNVDWSGVGKGIDPELVQQFTNSNLTPPAYYKRALVHGMEPLSEEQAQAEAPSMSILSLALADSVSLYDLSLQILGHQNFTDSGPSAKSDGLRVVDIGCGTGSLTRKLLSTHAGQIAHVDAVDASPYKLAKFFKSTPPDQLSKVSLHHMLGENLESLEDGCADRVVISFVFHELPQGICRKIITEAGRVLSPGGTIHVVDMDNQHPRIKTLGSTSVENWLIEPYMDSYLKMDVQSLLSRLNFTDVGRVTLDSPAPIAGFSARKPTSTS